MRFAIFVLFALLPGCSTSIERSYRECLLLDRDATYTQSRDMARMECRR